MGETEWPRTMDAVATRDQKLDAQSPSPSSIVGAADISNGAGATPLSSKKAVEISARTGKPKRRKALRACGNCQRTHLTCDDNRPCERCVKRGCADTCADGVRKKMKYLDKTTADSQIELHGSFPNPGLTSVYPGRINTSYSAMTSHRNSMPSLGNDTSAQSFPDLAHDHGVVHSAHPLGQADPTDHVDGMIVSPVAGGPNVLTPQHLVYLDGTERSRAAPHAARPSGTAGAPGKPGPPGHPSPPGPPGAPSSIPPGPHPTGHHLSEPSLLGSVHALSPGTGLQGPPPHAGDGNAYPAPNVAGASALVGHGDPNAFHSYAADSEYTVVARMLENSRAKSDQDFSPADTPTFTSSNVDLRNFVTLQPPSQDPEQNSADPGFSWLDPPPPPPPALVVQNRKSGISNYKRLDSDGSDQSVSAVLPLPSDIYRNVREPYPYTPAFHALLTFLKQRFAREQLMRIVRSMARIRPSFISVTKDLTHDDLVFMEQCFQRSLLEYEKYFAYSGTPSIVWRRTGQIAAVAPEFCMLTQWPRHELRSRFIVELMSDESAIDYFERFSEMTFTDTRGEIMYECYLLTPMGQQIRTSAVLTVRKDLFGIPMTVIGNFLPHV